MQSAQTLRTVPREYLKAPGGLNPNVLMVIAAIALLTISTTGYFMGKLFYRQCFGTTFIRNSYS